MNLDSKSLQLGPAGTESIGRINLRFTIRSTMASGVSASNLSSVMKGYRSPSISHCPRDETDETYITPLNQDEESASDTPPIDYSRRAFGRRYCTFNMYLGTHERRCAGYIPFPLVLLQHLNLADDAEIRQDRVSGRTDEDVVWLEIAVKQSLAM